MAYSFRMDLLSSNPAYEPTFSDSEDSVVFESSLKDVADLTQPMFSSSFFDSTIARIDAYTGADNLSKTAVRFDTGADNLTKTAVRLVQARITCRKPQFVLTQTWIT